jgi:hypothetical protein
MATRFRSFGRIRRRAEELVVRHGFDPLEEKIELAKCLKSMWLSESVQDATTVEIAALYLKCLDAITPYVYPRLKAIEVEREPAIEGRAPTELQLHMVQQIAWNLGYRLEERTDEDEAALRALKAPANGDGQAVASRRSVPT